MKTLIADSVLYLSSYDEDVFFKWLEKISSITKIYGERSSLFIQTDDLLNDDDLAEIIALFSRYNVSLRQLAVYRSDSNESWFADPNRLWFEQVFGGENLS